MKGPKMAKKTGQSKGGAKSRNGPAETEAIEFLQKGLWDENGLILNSLRRSSGMKLPDWFDGRNIHPVIGVRLMIEREDEFFGLLDLANSLPTDTSTGKTLVDEAYAKASELCKNNSVGVDEFLLKMNNQQILEKLKRTSVETSLISWLTYKEEINDPVECFLRIVERAEDPEVLFEIIRRDFAMPLVEKAREKINSLLKEADSIDPSKFLDKCSNSDILESLNSYVTEIDLCSWLIHFGLEPFNAIQRMIQRAKDPEVLSSLIWIHYKGLPKEWDEVILSESEKREYFLESGIDSLDILGEEDNRDFESYDEPPPNESDTEWMFGDQLNDEDTNWIYEVGDSMGRGPRDDDDDEDDAPAEDLREPVVMVELLMPGELLGDVEEKRAKQKPKRKSARKEAK
jgi:hypothetical protein